MNGSHHHLGCQVTTPPTYQHQELDGRLCRMDDRGEWNPISAPVQCTSDSEDGVCNDWEARIPATMGEIEIVYRITTFNESFSIEQPWLKMGTAPPPFEGDIWSARPTHSHSHS